MKWVDLGGILIGVLHLAMMGYESHQVDGESELS